MSAKEIVLKIFLFIYFILRHLRYYHSHNSFVEENLKFISETYSSFIVLNVLVIAVGNEQMTLSIVQESSLNFSLGLATSEVYSY